MNDEMTVKMAEVEQRARSNTRRIDKLEQANEALSSLATSVEVLVNEHKHQTAAMLDIKSDVSKLDQKVETLEAKPGKRWDSVVEKTLLVVVGAVVDTLGTFCAKFTAE